MKEIDKLRKMLVLTNIPFETQRTLWEHPMPFSFGRFKTNQVHYLDENGKALLNAIQQHGSVGYLQNLLEISGPIGTDKTGESVGYITAEAVYKIISEDWKRRKKNV